MLMGSSRNATLCLRWCQVNLDQSFGLGVGKKLVQAERAIADDLAYDR
jgi:hypothetical protein